VPTLSPLFTKLLAVGYVINVYVPMPNPPASVTLSVPPKVRLPLTTVRSLLVPNSYRSTDPLFSTRLLLISSVPALAPGASVAPLAIDTAPRTVPVPPSVPPLFTVPALPDCAPVTSSVPAEGKTFTACCLAGVFAQEPGRRVLLIDADLRKPGAGHQLGMNEIGPPEGLSQVLRGTKVAEDILLSSSKMDFFLLPAGPVPEDPAELLSSPSLELTIQRLSQLFDWVVIDSPPVISLADATLLAPLCDAVLLVVRAGKTPSKLIKQSVERIGREKICGLVINRSRKFRSSGYYYRYYYKDGRRAD
jgi:capsular exopolysaccharide synthesis family protein